MAQKVIKIVGTSKESFAKAAANAVAEAAKTVRSLKIDNRLGNALRSVSRSLLSPITLQYQNKCSWSSCIA